MNNSHQLNEIKTPSRAANLVFRGKAFLLQTRRRFVNAFDSDYRRFAKSTELTEAPVAAVSRTELWTETTASEQFLLRGKAQNLRVAVKQINGVEIPANRVFSFWAHVGRATRRRKFVIGRELREGCLIPNVGGGLCQLSNALYDAALQADFEIVERHAHSQTVAGSLAEQNRDATVFWNYVDLRFKSANAFRIEAELMANQLIVAFKSEKSAVKIKSKSFQTIPLIANHQSLNTINSCASCGVQSCFRSLKSDASRDSGRTAFLVDEFAPESDQYLQKTRRANDLLFAPINGKRFGKPNYAWTFDGFGETRQSFVATMIRAFKSRKLAAQGAARQRNLLESAEKLAASYAEKSPYDATHLVVQQNLLPFLWREGHLGGRTFDVLMTALPMRELQTRLDFAASLHAESCTLADFRADDSLVAAEAEALQAARKIVTPHSEIAALFASKAVPLDWEMPSSRAARQPRKSDKEKITIVFPASTVGRKGAFELREALRGIENVELVLLGAQLEGADFWRGFAIAPPTRNWLETVDLVVLPAFVEHKPRRLLAAVAANVPVIASTACGLANVAEVVNVRPGDAARLKHEILRILHKIKFAANIDSQPQPREIEISAAQNFDLSYN